MTIVRAFVLLLALTVPVRADGPPPFPFHDAYPPARMTAPACNGMAMFADIDDEWRTISNETRDVFVHLTNGDVDYVYFTIGHVASGPTIVRIVTLDEAKRLYPDPCMYLTEVST